MKAQRPATFEEMYSAAKVRVAKKSAKERQGGVGPNCSSSQGRLPGFPGGSSRISSWLEPGKSEDSVEAHLWAASALAGVPGEEHVRLPSAPVTEAAERDGREKRASVQLVAPTQVETGSAEPSEQERLDQHADAPPETSPALAKSGTSGTQVSRLAPGMSELLDNIAARNAGTNEGFTVKELSRLTTAFGRFKIPGESDIHTTDMPDLLSYLGHVVTMADKVASVVRQVTMYDYMDFDEFVTFMEKFIDFEREEFRNTFEEFDEDGSGEISVKELRKLTKALGFVPLRQMVDEALGIVDADGNGQLNFEELITFLAVYKFNEGFTRSEVTDIRRQFDFFAVDGGEAYSGDRVLPPEFLSDALVQAFGLQVSPITQKMSDQLASGQGLQKSSFDKGGGEPECLRFPEFLIFARKVREEEFNRCKKEHPQYTARLDMNGVSLANEEAKNDQADLGEFLKSDIDKSGGISEEELRICLTSKGYTPLTLVVDEIIEEIYDGEWNPGKSELDFEEFFDFLLLLEQRDGFSKSEVAQLRETYDQFDEDGSGEVSAMECAEIFRFVGYRVSLEDLREEILQVDKNGSGQLDFREFLRLMRLYREKELKALTSAFRLGKDETGTVPLTNLDRVLAGLGHAPPPSVPKVGTRGFDFDDLVNIVDSCRSAFVAKERKKAGFSDEEIEHMQDIYDKFDTNKNGIIDNMELLGILKEFSWEPRSREQQTALMRKLDQARNAARDAGVEDVGDAGSSTLTFWSFIQLARTLRTEFDKAQEARLQELQKTLRFSEGEVEDFRQIFRAWVKRAAAINEDATGDKRGDQTAEVLNRDMIRRLVRSLGISIAPANATLLDKQLVSLDDEGRLESAQLDFFAFLKLMRWILDNDFAGINDAAAKLAPG